jgi:hypothetical protein
MESGSMLHEHLQILHEGSWLHNNKKVCEKVELYDFKWSALQEATQFLFICIYMTVYIVLFNRTIK